MTSADAILLIGDRDPERLEQEWSHPPTNFHRKTIAICMGPAESEVDILTQQDIPISDSVYPNDHELDNGKLRLHPQHLRHSHYLKSTTSRGHRSLTKPLLLALSLLLTMVAYLGLEHLLGNRILSFALGLLLALVLYTSSILARGWIMRRRLDRARREQFQAKSRTIATMSYRGRYVEVDVQDVDFLHVSSVLGIIARHNALAERGKVSARDRDELFSMIASSLMPHNSMLILEDHLAASQDMLQRTYDIEEREQVLDQVDRARRKLTREMGDLGLDEMRSQISSMEAGKQRLT